MIDTGTLANAVWGAVFLVVILIVLVGRARGRRSNAPRRGGVGSGAAGAVYDWLNQDKQKAIDIIVEGQAEARRPEYPAGNLPDLDSPEKPAR